MKSIKIILSILTVLPFLMMTGCGGGGGGGTPVLVSISVAPANSTVAAGNTFQYKATGAYSNGLSLDVTGNATWSSLNTAVATVSGNTVTTVAAGTTTITATIGGVSGSTTLTVTGGGVVASNVLNVTVNGSLCSNATTYPAPTGSAAGLYFNKPCVSVTVCTPDGSACQTVDDILLDTGSYGLRIFKSALAGLPLQQVTSGAGSLTECTQFADGSSDWGPVQIASVKLGNEPAVQIPIQVIDSTFGTATRPSPCANADTSAIQAQFTGILGIGVAQEDCGQGCVSDTTNQIYYSCDGTNCSGAAVPLASQVQNPVPHFTVDNNGLIVQLPPVPTGGVSTISGAVLFGIGTQSNNAPGSVTVFPTDNLGEFNATYVGNSFNAGSFLDTGSNAYFIPNVNPTVLPLCSGNPSWYCPALTTALVATNTGINGTPSLEVQFNVSNFNAIFTSGNHVFSDIAGTSTFGFDWGLPFFMGRNTVFGITGKPAPTLLPTGQTGPFVAY